MTNPAPPEVPIDTDGYEPPEDVLDDAVGALPPDSPDLGDYAGADDDHADDPNPDGTPDEEPTE